MRLRRFTWLTKSLAVIGAIPVIFVVMNVVLNWLCAEVESFLPHWLYGLWLLLMVLVGFMILTLAVNKLLFYPPEVKE